MESIHLDPGNSWVRRRIAILAAASALAGLAVVVAATGFAGASNRPAVAAPGSGCAAVAIITARASGEPAGEGITGALVTQIVNGSKQTVSRASVTYPATLANYLSSSAQGTSALETQLTNQVQACPSQKIVLLGYSQGAQVVLDALGGGGSGILGGTTAPVAATVSSHVAAVVSFGDPRHVTGQAFDQGTATRNGLFPRTAAQLQALSGFAGRTQAYCDSGDEFCAGGANLQVHLTYLNRYQSAATTFVLGKIGG